MNRRSFLGKTGIGTAALGVAPAVTMTSCAAPQQNAADDDGQVLFLGDDIAVANTSYGKVKGYILKDVYTFLGVPYGADTSGPNRFMPPQKPAPWDDVRPAVFWASSAPQVVSYDRSPESYSAFVDRWNYDVIGEDCLRMNIWTPGLDAEKRPVMVWLHGGGFSSGNAVEQDGYKGENFARYQNVVSCSINHRLNSFGFSDLSAVGGEKYKNSGNVGMLDIIAALEWINENIANFGGDPNNVTVMGQSGGGSKVCTVASMPAAKGLVHKGVALSGSAVASGDKAAAQKLGEAILKEAGLTPAEVDKLQEMPWQEYYDLANRASRSFREANPGMRASFGPIADGVNIPADGFFQPGNSSIPNIPMIFCTTFHERTPTRTDAVLEEITLDGVIDQLRDSYGDRTPEIVAAYNSIFSNLKPVEVWAMIGANRTRVVQAANTKLQQGSPVYVAWFGWKPPLFDGRLRAFHCSDICFWYRNTDLMLSHTGGGARPRALSIMMSDALVNFMKTGNPNGGGLTHWAQFTEAKGETMVLDDAPALMNDPDREARQTLES